ncbi:hypothetical protein Tco_0074121 [Tanacetum coccineum]
MKPSNLEYNGWGDGGVGASDVWWVKAAGDELVSEGVVDDDDGVKVVVTVAAGGGERRVEARGKGDRIDRKMGTNFAFGRKSPPENFSGGGGVAVAGGGWWPAKQTALAISTTEAEYVSAGKACQQALWMKQALIDYDVRLDDVPIMCDNKGAIDLSKNPVQHSRTKHIKIRHHFLRDNVQKGHISIEKVPSVDNIADILTKPLKRESFNYLRLGLGMMEHIP